MTAACAFALYPPLPRFADWIGGIGSRSFFSLGKEYKPPGIGGGFRWPPLEIVDQHECDGPPRFWNPAELPSDGQNLEIPLLPAENTCNTALAVTKVLAERQGSAAPMRGSPASNNGGSADQRRSRAIASRCDYALTARGRVRRALSRDYSRPRSRRVATAREPADNPCIAFSSFADFDREMVSFAWPLRREREDRRAAMREVGRQRNGHSARACRGHFGIETAGPGC